MASKNLKKASGSCTKCNKPRLVNRTRCADCLEKQRCLFKNRHIELKNAAFHAYGGYVCNCCGLKYKSALELDHVNGGGNEHRQSNGGNNTGVYRWLKDNNYPKGMMQVLCASCNKAKHLDGHCYCKEYRADL